MPSKTIKNSLKDASYDLKFLLNRGYRKKIALNFVAGKYLLNKDERNFLVRKVFSNKIIASRTSKLIDIDDVNNKTIFIDGYNVLITVESICNHEYDSVILCDDGILRDIKSVFGKYKSSSSTKSAINCIITTLGEHNPKAINFLYDSPVSNSGELAKLTDSMIKMNGLHGSALTNKSVDYELVKLSKNSAGIVATSDGAIIDKVKKVIDIPYLILKKSNRI